MRNLKGLLLFVITLSLILVLTACWNYREVDEIAVVAGVAIDEGTRHKYRITVEYVEISSEKGTKPKPKTITTEGETIFDAVRNEIALSGKRLYWAHAKIVRNEIALSGKRLYWAHAKIVIISQKLAEDGVLQVMDWYNRDAETRADVNVVVSKAKTAGEVFTDSSLKEDIVGFNLNSMIKNDKSLSKISATEIWKFSNDLSADGISAATPAIELLEVSGKKIPSLIGTAIFESDHLKGFIDAMDTQSYMFIQNEVNGGVLVGNVQGKGNVSLEIFKSKTNVKPVVKNNEISFQIEVKTTVAIDEIQGSIDYMDEKMNEKLQKNVENELQKRLETFIKKIQSEYGLDIFGFGNKLRQKNVKTWKKVSDHWNEVFKNLPVHVTCHIDIENSAMMAEPIKKGD